MFNVLVLDSGLGGASIIKRIREKCNNLNIVFYVENKHSPLGNMNKKQLLELVIKIINEQEKKIKIDMLVLACNTLTSACVYELRKMFQFEIIGTEPNVKVNRGKTLVLATNYTIKNCNILKNKAFDKVALPKLSKLIDRNFPQMNKCYRYLKSKLGKYKNVDNVICGCTHYFFVKEELKNIFGNVNIFDSVEGVSNRVRQLTKNIENYEQSLVIQLAKNSSKKDQKFLSELVNYLK